MRPWPSRKSDLWPEDTFPLKPHFRKLPWIAPPLQAKAYRRWRRGDASGAMKQLLAATKRLPKGRRDQARLALAHQAMSFADAPRAMALYKRLRRSRQRRVALTARLMIGRYQLMQYSPGVAYRVVATWPKAPQKPRDIWLAGWLVRATAAAQIKRYAEAIKSYQHLIKHKAPVAGYAAYQHLRLLLKQRQYKGLERSALAYRKRWPKSRYRRQIQQLRARALERRGKYKLAYRRYRALARRGSTSAQLGAIRCQLKFGARSAAIRALLQLLRKKPGGWVANSAARMLRRLGYKATVPSVQYAMAYHKYRRGQFKQAIAGLQRLLKQLQTPKARKLRPTWEPKVLYLRSRAQFRIKEYDAARRGLTAFQRRYPRHRKRLAVELLAIRNRYRQRKDLATALQYEAFARRHKGTSLGRKALWWAAQLIFEHGKTKRATRLFRAYARRYSRSSRKPEAILKIGLIAYQQKQYARTASVLRQLHRWGGRFGARALFWTGKAHLKRGDKARALRYFRKISPFAEAYYSARARQYTSRRPILAKRPVSLYRLLADHREDKGHRVSMRRWLARGYPGQSLHRIAATLRRSEDYRRAHLFALAGHMRSVRSALSRRTRRPKHPAEVYLISRAWAAFGDPNRTLYTAGLFRRKVPRSRRKRLPFWPLLRLLYPVPYPAIYMRYGKKYQIDPLLLVGLTRQESLFNPRIVSGAGARGIAQIMPKEGKKMAQRWKIKGYRLQHLFRPQLNLRMGFHHFREYLNKHGGHVELTLAAYNAGPGALKRWIKAAPSLPKKDIEAFIEYGIGYRETRIYVRYCLRWYSMYKFAFAK